MVLDPPKEKVDVTLMIIFSFIPILGIYAAWRIQKFWMILLIEMAISIVFTIAIIPVAFILAEMSMFIGLAAGIAINVLLVKHYAEKYNEKMGFLDADNSDQKITKYIEFKSNPKKQVRYNSSKNTIKQLKKIFPKKALVIGILSVVVVFGVAHILTYNTMMMDGSAMWPTIKNSDLIRYDNTDFNDIVVGDIIIYERDYSTHKFWVHNVIEIGQNDHVITQNEEKSNRHYVPSHEYVGKVVSITGGGELFRIFQGSSFYLLITVAIFTPIIIIWNNNRRTNEDD